jgi:hypothetical protein
MVRDVDFQPLVDFSNPHHSEIPTTDGDIQAVLDVKVGAIGE